MNKDSYGEIINGPDTFRILAEGLPKYHSIIIGWTDGAYDHRDIMFTLWATKDGNLQSGRRWANFYVSIMGFSCAGFALERYKSNQMHPGYIKEKLSLNDNSCDDKICELINGVIRQLDIELGYDY